MKLTKRNMKKLAPKDRKEVERFQEFLRDTPRMNADQLWDKYGEAYLGKKPEAAPKDPP